MGHRYLQIDLATARPETLVARLLQRALEKAREAHARSDGAARVRDDSAARVRALAQSIDILAELRRALDLQAGGELAANLERLYDFATDRLISAGATRASGTIEEAIRALEPIVEAFSAIAVAQPAAHEGAP